MHHVIIALLAVCTADSPVTLTTLAGTSVSGEFQQLQTDQLILLEEGTPRTFPQADLLELRWNHPTVEVPDLAEVQLVDGSVLRGKITITADAGQLAGSPAAGTYSRRNIKSIRWSPLDQKVATSWQDLTARQPKEDLVVVRKGDVLDFIAGAIGDVTESSIAIVTGSRELQAPRERVFGIIFADRPEPRTKTLALLQLVLAAVSGKGDDWEVTLRSGTQLKLPTTALQKLDFGGGRIRLLADLPYSAEGSTSPDPLFPVVWFVSRNSPPGFGPEGKPLKIGKSEYQKGLWMCGNAVVRYRLNREFSRLQSIAGFELTEQANMPRFDPQVELIIEADGEVIHQQLYRWDTPPAQLDLDLRNARELVLKVVSRGAQPGILDFFALGDAKLLK
jgi:hypothetical protein